MDDKDKEYLEHYIDKFGLKHVVEALVEIAHDKAAHIAESWQDTQLAKLWTRRANALNRAVPRLNGELDRLKSHIIQHHTKEESDD